ncbi:hypothetical protein D9M70_431170 [compost metagenome]
MRRRSQKLELLLRLQRLLARQHLGADVVADDHQLGLAGDEGLDHGIVVVEALNVGVGGSRLGERGVLERAAVDGNGLLGKVFLTGDLELGRTDDGDVVRCVGGGEVDHLGAFLGEADAHQDVNALVVEIGNAVLAGDADEVELDAEVVGDLLGDIDVIALDAHVGAGRGEGREVGEDADIDLAGGLDIGKRIGLGDAGGRTEHQGGSECCLQFCMDRHGYSPTRKLCDCAVWWSAAVSGPAADKRLCQADLPVMAGL